MKNRLLKSTIILLFLLIFATTIVSATDTSTISDVDIDQTKTDISWYGVEGQSIAIEVEVEFTVKVGDSTPNIWFKFEVTKSGSSVILSEGTHMEATVTNDTKTVITVDINPIIMSATGKAGPNGEVSLKKEDKMTIDIKMYYYAVGEATETILDTVSETFYLLSSPPASDTTLIWIIIIIIVGAGLAVLFFWVYRQSTASIIPKNKGSD